MLNNGYCKDNTPDSAFQDGINQPANYPLYSEACHSVIFAPIKPDVKQKTMDMKQVEARLEFDVPTEQLPSWMRRARQSVDWGILLVFLFSITAAWGFILHDSLPHTNAGEHHVYATAEYSQALREGVLYPRWSTTAMGGYGAPIYTYYPPALPYISAIVDVLFADDPVLAVRLVMIGAFVLAGSMCYVLVLRVGGAMPALLATILYLYSPYINLTAPHILGDYQAVLTFALYPMALWNLNRLLTFRNPFDLALGAIIYAGLILVDPRSMGAALGLALPMLGWWRWHRRESQRQFLGGVMRFLIAVCLGVGLSAFYWLPALLERGDVQWITSERSTVDDYLTWGELLFGGEWVDTQQLNPAPSFQLGAGLIASLIGFGVLIGRGRRVVRKYHQFIWHFAYLVWGLVLLIGVMLLATDAVWMLPPIILCLALGGSGVSLVRYAFSPRFRWVLAPVLVALGLALNIGAWTGTRPPAPFGATDAYARINYELQGYGNAVLAPEQPIPSYLDADYMINQALIDGYRERAPIRIPNLRLSGAKLANFVYANSHSDRYVIIAREAATFDILRAYDTGWGAWLDGQSIELKPNPANGLMQALIPIVDSGQLDIRYTSTTPRLWGWLLAGAVGVVLMIRTTGRMLRYVTHEQDDDLDYLRNADARLMAVVALGFSVIVALHASPTIQTTLHAPAGHRLNHFTGIFARSTHGLEIFAYDYQPVDTGYQAGEHLQFDLAWRTVQPLTENYQARISIWSDQYFKRWSYVILDELGGYPTSRWETDYYLLDHVALPLADLPTGTYRVGLEVLLCEAVCRLDSREVFFDLNGELIGSLVFLPFRIMVE